MILTLCVQSKNHKKGDCRTVRSVQDQNHAMLLCLKQNVTSKSDDHPSHAIHAFNFKIPEKVFHFTCVTKRLTPQKDAFRTISNLRCKMAGWGFEFLIDRVRKLLREILCCSTCTVGENCVVLPNLILGSLNLFAMLKLPCRFQLVYLQSRSINIYMIQL